MSDWTLDDLATLIELSDFTLVVVSLSEQHPLTYWAWDDDVEEEPRELVIEYGTDKVIRLNDDSALCYRSGRFYLPDVGEELAIVPLFTAGWLPSSVVGNVRSDHAAG